MSLWWLGGDRDAARQSFVAAGKIPVSYFDAQMQAIDENWGAISDLFSDHVIESVHAGPRYILPEEIFNAIERSGPPSLLKSNVVNSGY